MRGLVGKGSRQGSTWFGKAGDLVQQPPLWAGVAGVLSSLDREAAGRR